MMQFIDQMDPSSMIAILEGAAIASGVPNTGNALASAGSTINTDGPGAYYGGVLVGAIGVTAGGSVAGPVGAAVIGAAGAYAGSALGGMLDSPDDGNAY